jgi:hypothetical protein
MPDLPRSLDRVERLDISRMGHPHCHPQRQPSRAGARLLEQVQAQPPNSANSNSAPWVALPNPLSSLRNYVRT